MADDFMGTTIGGFRIVSVIGRDSAGTTAFAVISEDGDERGTLRLVQVGRSAAFRDRFLGDAGRLAGVEHPSLPAVLGRGESAEGAYVVTGEVRARSLAAVADEGLAPDRAIQMLSEAADALDAAHGAGLLHRQLRPANVVVGGWLVVHAVLVNFALGRPRDGTDVPDDEQVPYAAPEELCGESVGPPADHYAFAATLFELLVGTPPFGRLAKAARDGHLGGPPPQATAAVPGLPLAVDAVFARALAKDPHARYASAAGLISELSRALDGSPPTDESPRGGQGPPEPEALEPDEEEETAPDYETDTDEFELPRAGTPATAAPATPRRAETAPKVLTAAAVTVIVVAAILGLLL